MLAGFTFATYESKFALKQRLATAGPRAVLVGDNVEAPHKCFCLTLRIAGGAPVDIGLVYEGLGTNPSFQLLGDGEILLIGYDTYVAAVRIADAGLCFQVELPSVFFEFLEGANDDTAIVIHEVGATMLDAKGDERWSVIVDTLREWHADARGGLWLKTSDGERCVRVDIVSGRVSDESKNV